MLQESIENLYPKTDIDLLHFKDFGKRYITSELGMGPDAFCQIAYHINTYRLKGEFYSAYESSSVKNFLHGRTETIRTLTPEVHRAVLTFLDKTASQQDKITSLAKADERHKEIVNESKTGKAIDRHLQGLCWSARQKSKRVAEYNMPSLFLDPTYSTFMSNKLSTSNIGEVNGMSTFGFGPVHPEGFGLGYYYTKDNINVVITNFNGEASRFKDGLHKTFHDLKKSFDALKKTLTLSTTSVSKR